MQEVGAEVTIRTPPVSFKRETSGAERSFPPKFPGARNFSSTGKLRSNVNRRRSCTILREEQQVFSSTHHDHLGGLEDEAFVGSPRAATRPLAEAATENHVVQNPFSTKSRETFFFFFLDKKQ